jgi:hypothetical protein
VTLSSIHVHNRLNHDLLRKWYMYITFVLSSPHDIFTHINRICELMVSVLVWSAIDRRFQPHSGQSKDYEIDICCFSAKHAALMRKNKDWLVRNQNNVSQWSDMSTRGLLFQLASTMKIQPSCWLSTKRTSSTSYW